jgi:hypothetical protein
MLQGLSANLIKMPHRNEMEKYDESENEVQNEELLQKPSKNLKIYYRSQP